MSLFIVIFSIIFLLYVAIYNGLFLREKDEREKSRFVQAAMWNRAWHGWGFLLRIGAAVILVPFFWHDWKELLLWILVICNVSWTVFDIIINLFRSLSVFYKGSKQSGTGSFIDRVLNSTVLYWGLKILLLLTTIIYSAILIN